MSSVGWVNSIKVIGLWNATATDHSLIRLQSQIHTSCLPCHRGEYRGLGIVGLVTKACCWVDY